MDNQSIKNKVENYKTIYVHSGPFHSDDLLAVCFMQSLNPNIKFSRIDEVTPKILTEAKEGNALICDIGNVYDLESNIFDHHQKSDDVISKKPSWDKYKSLNYHSSFGLLWKDFGDYYCEKFKYNEKTKEKFYDFVVSQIDAVDNGRKISATTDFPLFVKSMLNPVSSEINNKNEKQVYDKAFSKGLEVGKQFIDKSFKDINLFLNQGKAEKDLTSRNFYKERIMKTDNIISKLYSNRRNGLPYGTDQSKEMKCFFTEILNTNKNEKNLVSEISSMATKYLNQLDRKDKTDILETYDIAKMYLGNQIAKTGIVKLNKKFSLRNFREFYSKPHALTSIKTEKPVNVIKSFSYISKNGQEVRENNLIDLADNNNSKLFVFDGTGKTYMKDDFTYSSRLEDVLSNGGILYVRNFERSDNKEKYDELYKIIQTGKYKNMHGEILQVSPKTVVYVDKVGTKNFNKEFINKFYPEETSEYKKMNMPIAITYPQRNGLAMKFSIDVTDNLKNFNFVSISSDLYITNKNETDYLGAVSLLTTKNYSDKIIDKQTNTMYGLKNNLEAILSKPNVFERIVENPVSKQIIRDCQIPQFVMLKTKVENNIEKVPAITLDFMKDKEDFIINKIEKQVGFKIDKTESLSEICEKYKDISDISFEINMIDKGYEKITIKSIDGETNEEVYSKGDEIFRKEDFEKYFKDEDCVEL